MCLRETCQKKKNNTLPQAKQRSHMFKQIFPKNEEEEKNISKGITSRANASSDFFDYLISSIGVTIPT